MTFDHSRADMNGNPLFQSGASWYFYDETWSNTHGPFDTYEEASEAHKRYCYFLDNGPNYEEAPKNSVNS